MIDKEKSENKLISVIMSFYNSEKFINESVKSILNQSYKNFEFLIEAEKRNSKVFQPLFNFLLNFGWGH